MNEPLVNQQEYAGFWIRITASIVDTVLLLIVILPILTLIYGTEYWTNDSLYNGTWDALLNYLFPAVAVILFWLYKSATPGKMLTKIRIVDAKTGGTPSKIQFFGRYIGYILSAIPLLLGYFWVAFDKRKQGWHDKLAGTVVIKTNVNKSVDL